MKSGWRAAAARRMRPYFRALNLIRTLARLGGPLRPMLSLRAVGRAIQRAQQRREVANAERLLERDLARAKKPGRSRSLGLDVYGSVARRAEQEKRDAAEIAKPVRSVFSGGAGFLNLRPIAERVVAREPQGYVSEFRLETGRSKRYKPARVARRARKAKRGWA